MNTKTGKLFGVGLGPGDPGLVTLKALAALQEADEIFCVISRQSSRSVSTDIVESLPDIKADVTPLVFAMRDDSERSRMVGKNAAEIAVKLREGRDCVFATIGDPMTYSTFGYVMRELKKSIPDLEVEVVPGVNSWSALAAAERMVLVEDKEPLVILPSHDSPADIHSNSSSVKVYLKTYRTKNEVLDFADSGSADILYGANIGLEDEFVSTSPDEIRSADNRYLSMLIVKNEKKEDEN